VVEIRNALAFALAAMGGVAGLNPADSITKYYCQHSTALIGESDGIELTSYARQPEHF
jgi:hypothetical protein